MKFGIMLPFCILFKMALMSPLGQNLRLLSISFSKLKKDQFTSPLIHFGLSLRRGTIGPEHTRKHAGVSIFLSGPAFLDKLSLFSTFLELPYGAFCRLELLKNGRVVFIKIGYAQPGPMETVTI